MQHKKRGRPRLREEESLRGLTFRSEYPSDDFYQGQNGVLSAGNSNRHRSKTYRELRSQPESPYSDHRPCTSDATFTQQQYLRGGPAYPLSPTVGSFISEHVPTAILTTDFVVAQHNRALTDALSLSFTARGQGLLDLVVPAEKERIRRLQSSIRAELRDMVHAAYMNRGPSSHASIPAIEHLDLAQVTAGFQTRSEYWTFRLPREQSRGFPISISLAREGGFFVILTLVQSTNSVQPLQSPTLQQSFRNQHILPSASAVRITPSPPKSSHATHSQHNHRRTVTSDAGVPYLMSPASSTLDEQILNMHASNSLAQYKQTSPPRSVQLPYNASRTDSSGSNSSMPRSSPSHQHQPISRDHLRDLQLPPIRTTPTSDPSARKEDPSRRRYKSGTPSPSRSSPHSTKRKKRRRLEIGDVLH